MLEIQYLWSGVILALVFGLALGNYACSFIHRLPLGKSILANAPHCGTCGVSLQPRDLFPVFSALFLHHKCRYCGTKFPITYTIVEILIATLSVITFLKYGFSDVGLLTLAIGIFLIILATIEASDGVIMGKIMLCIIVAGMLLRTLIDHTLFNFVLGGLFGVITGAIIWRKQIAKVGHIYKLPKQAELMAMAGICTGAAQFPLFLGLFAIIAACSWLIKCFYISVIFVFSLLIVFMIQS